MVGHGICDRQVDTAGGRFEDTHVHAHIHMVCGFGRWLREILVKGGKLKEAVELLERQVPTLEKLNRVLPHYKYNTVACMIRSAGTDGKDTQACVAVRAIFLPQAVAMMARAMVGRVPGVALPTTRPEIVFFPRG